MLKDYIKAEQELINKYEALIANVQYKDSKVFYKHGLKQAKFNLKMLKIANKLCNFRLKMHKFC